MVVVGRDELIEGHPAVGLMAEKIHHLFSKLLGALHLLHGALCGEVRAALNQPRNHIGVTPVKKKKAALKRTSLGNRNDHVCVLMSYSDGGVGDLREQVHQVAHAIVHDLPVSGEAPDKEDQQMN